MVIIDGEKKPYLAYPKFYFSSKLPLDEYTYSNCLKRFENHELFWYYTRGMICGMSSFPIRQNYVEPFTPYGDVEFMEAYLSIPWECRVKGKLLSKWLIKKYPQMAGIDYAATGITLRDEFNLKGKAIKVVKLVNQEIHRHLHTMHKGYAMTPFEHWYKSNSEIRKFVKEYYQENIGKVKSPVLRKKVDNLFDEGGTFEDKALALTVIAYHKLFLD